MAKSKKALGRGIGAILEDVEEAYRQDIEDKSNLIMEIELDEIVPNIYQPRTYFNETALLELSESIKKHGLLQPIIVVKKDDGYMLIAGERRLRASKMAGLSHIKAIVADIESENLRELALIENIQRENLNPIELAIAYHELIEQYNITHDELSEIIHKSRAQITNTLRLLNLTEKTKKLISENKISQGHAKILVGLTPKEEESVVNTIIGQKLSVRETEKIVKMIKGGNSTPLKEKKRSKKLKNIKILSERLKSYGFKCKEKSNQLIIEFDKEEEISDLLSMLDKR
ncbi:MAG: ParB/RepB/Spo0J family partition protein [Epsilonproteobacteria bacterium]|nr:ParB/RepB/Spo0J family partition protein [Campylobacterota bacterium]